MNIMPLPTEADIEAAYLHGRWLRGKELGSESRMLADLSIEVQRLREDKARLDWLNASTPHIFWSAVCNHPTNPEGECAVATGPGVVFYAKSYRAAIDAAMQSG